MDADIVLAVLRALNQEEVAYKVIGAVAMNLHGLPRGTKDLDIFVAPDAENIARLRSALKSVFDDPCIDEITHADLAGDYPAVEYGPPLVGFHIDILTRLGEAFTYDTIEAETLRVEGVELSVATPAMLYRMKRDTVRPQDKADAARIRDRYQLEG